MNTAENLKPQPRSLKSVLRATPQKEATTTKSKTPMLTVDEATRELAETIRKAKEQQDEATAVIERLSADLINRIKPLRQELCQREYISSVKVPCEVLNLAITWSSSYKKIPPSLEQELIKILGETAYHEYFGSKFVISATDKTDEQLMELFAWLAPDDGATEEGLSIGQDRFSQFFTVEEIIKPTERFVRDHVLMAESKKQELELAGVTQFKPSIRIR
jgi:hypothetical protein